MAFLRTWCILALAGGFLLGCSNGSLDRTTAAKEIQSHFKDTQNTIVINVGRVSANCVHVNRSDGREVNEDLNPETNLRVIVAIKAGYATATPDGEGFWKIALTDKGKTAQDPTWTSGGYHNQLKGCDYRLAGFIVAHPELAGITGISGDQKEPTVDFEWKWIATELGAALRENGGAYSQLTPQQKQALSSVIQNDPPTAIKVPVPVPAEGQTEKETVKFKKYDGGWRSQ